MTPAVAFSLLAVTLAACAQSTPINQLSLPAPSIISGEVVSVEDAETFVLRDESGRIEVEWEGENLRPALRPGETLTVAGIVDEDESIGEASVFAEEFDAYCIRRADGTLLQAVPLCPLTQEAR